MKNNKKRTKSRPPGKRSQLEIRKPQEAFWKKQVPAALIIFLVTLGLYFRTVGFDYTLDDKIVICDNVFTSQGVAGISKIFTNESFTGYFQKQQDLVAGSRYRPLSIVTFAMEYQFFQRPKEDGYGNPVNDANGKQLMSGNPAISHIINVLLYAFCGLLLFRVLSLLFPAKQGDRWYLSIPFAATVLFIVHPLHTEVVANIKGRDEIMALLFSLAALYYALRYVRRKKIYYLLMGTVCFFLATLSKENALTFVAIIPLTLYFFTNSKKSSIIGISLPFLFVAFIYMFIRVNVIGFIVKDAVITDLMNNPFFGMDSGHKLATIIYTLGLYIKLLFIPHPLTHDYYPFAIPVMSFSNWQTLASIALWILLGFMAFRGLKKKDPLSYSVLFFILTLSMASNLLLPVGTFMNERFVFMSSVGFCMGMAYLLLEKLPALFTKQQHAIGLAGMIILVSAVIYFSVTTFIRIPAWKNNYTLDEADIVTSANSSRANCFMSLGLFKKSQQIASFDPKMKLLNRADAYLKRSLEIYPANSSSFQMMSVVAAEEFKYDSDDGKLLNSFAVILPKIQNPEEIDRYLLWMNGQGKYNQHLIPFYHKIAYDRFLKQEHDTEKADKYCRMGLGLDPTNAILQKDLREIQAAKSFTINH
jgi:hypothetical protein